MSGSRPGSTPTSRLGSRTSARRSRRSSARTPSAAITLTTSRFGVAMPWSSPGSARAITRVRRDATSPEPTTAEYHPFAVDGDDALSRRLSTYIDAARRPRHGGLRQLLRDALRRRRPLPGVHRVVHAPPGSRGPSRLKIGSRTVPSTVRTARTASSAARSRRCSIRSPRRRADPQAECEPPRADDESRPAAARLQETLATSAGSRSRRAQPEAHRQGTPMPNPIPPGPRCPNRTRYPPGLALRRPHRRRGPPSRPARVPAGARAR